MAQSDLTSRVFTYDGSTATNGTALFEVDNTTVTASSTLNNNLSGATAAGANFTVKTVIRVRTYVYLSGNFGAEYEVTGAGTNTDSARTNDIELRSNRALTFSTTGFTTLRDSGNNSVNVGTMLYALTLFQDNPAGTQIGSPITGTDTGFNSLSLSAALSDLPANGKMTLRLSRTLTINQTAEGAQTYNATGTIGLAVN
jgi:hypothetical protein